MVQLPAHSHRAGLLTQGSILSVLGKFDTTAPVTRGVFVREKLLCQSVPPPPDDVVFEPPTVDPEASVRERLAQHREDPSCASCHALMDPVGFGFEHFDSVGRFRASQFGYPIDASGELIAAGEISGNFNGVHELAAKIAESEQAHRCIVKNWFRYGYGREESERDACTLEQLESAFMKKGNLRELILDLTQTDAFQLIRRGEDQD